MKKKPSRYLIFCLFCLLFVFLSCASIIGDPSLEKSASLNPTAKTPAFEEFTLIPTATSTPVNPECWERLFQIEDIYGFPLVMREGPDQSLWVLYPKELVHIIDKENIERIKFTDFSPCETCVGYDKATMVVDPSGDVFIGSETGLWVLKQRSVLKFYPIKDLFPNPLDRFEVYSLLTDNQGRVWISQANSLCYFTKETWKCFQLSELKIPYDEGKDFYYDQVISGVAGKGEQIWFGTRNGRIVKLDGKRIEVDDLYDQFHSDISNILSISYNEKDDSVWAINTTISACSDYEEYRSSYAVLQRRKSGEWIGYPKDLFIVQDSKSGGGCGFFPTIITNTRDGRVWLGFMWQIGLTYYEDHTWMGINGKKLPISDDLAHMKYMSTCGLPEDSWITDILETTDGRLLVSDRFGVFVLKKDMLASFGITR